MVHAPTSDQDSKIERVISGSLPNLSDSLFQKFSRFVHDECGIKLAPAKRTMLEGRLQKRLRHLGLRSFEEYYDHVTGPRGRENELVHMINAVTTNKTDFFREANHFDFLVQQVLPDLSERTGAGFRKPLWIWSAGCSSGEEPYTLAMVLNEYARGMNGFNFGILATDISMTVLEKAKKAIYDEDRVKPVPMELRKRYLLRSKDPARRVVRVRPEVRSRVRFRRLNFVEGDFGMREPMDVIFCRNVIIYFDRPTQERLLNRFCSHLIPGGYLFLGHSESIHGLAIPLVPTAPTVYRKPL